MRRMPAASALVVVVLACGAPAWAQERLGPIPADQMTEAQKQAAAAFEKDRGRPPYAFWLGYLRIPEIVVPFLEIQAHVHGVMETEKGALGEKLTQLAILLAARHWSSEVIWSLHDQHALKSGITPEVMAAVAAGRRPEKMSDDEALLYDFTIELQQNQSISDATYARMLARFGERGIAEATLIQGEYSTMAMFINVARTPLGPGAQHPLRRFPQ